MTRKSCRGLMALAFGLALFARPMAVKNDSFASLAGLNPVGVSASQSRLLVSVADCMSIYSVAAAAPHAATLYATLPAHLTLPMPSNCEGYLVAAPGPSVVAGFPAENVYAAQGNLIYVLPKGSNTP